MRNNSKFMLWGGAFFEFVAGVEFFGVGETAVFVGDGVFEDEVFEGH